MIERKELDRVPYQISTTTYTNIPWSMYPLPMVTRLLLITIQFLHNTVPHYLYLLYIIFLEISYQVDECMGDIFLFWSQLITRTQWGSYLIAVYYIYKYTICPCSNYRLSISYWFNSSLCLFYLQPFVIVEVTYNSTPLLKVLISRTLQLIMRVLQVAHFIIFIPFLYSTFFNFLPFFFLPFLS